MYTLAQPHLFFHSYIFFHSFFHRRPPPLQTSTHSPPYPSIGAPQPVPSSSSATFAAPPSSSSETSAAAPPSSSSIGAPQSIKDIPPRSRYAQRFIVVGEYTEFIHFVFQR
ncbi:hypothetical protein HanPI659440_Chr16g0625861 [Helianthus annuus]|nr:hypothetical protein HanPI659440_Chr16g0625861 [Helianthus annuus]